MAEAASLGQRRVGDHDGEKACGGRDDGVRERLDVAIRRTGDNAMDGGATSLSDAVRGHCGVEVCGSNMQWDPRMASGVR